MNMSISLSNNSSSLPKNSTTFSPGNSTLSSNNTSSPPSNSTLSPNNMTSSPPSSNRDAVVSIVSIVAGSIVTVIVVFLIVKYRRRRLKSERAILQISSDTPSTVSPATLPLIASSTTRSIGSKIEATSIERFLDEILKENPVRFTPQHLTEFTQNYCEKLGSGGFGQVYKGQLPNGILVAVKVLNSSLMDKRAEEQFMAEVGTIGRTYHINLVRLYGFCFDSTLKALVYEYMEYGSLDGYLFNEKDKLEWSKLYEIAIGTAKGIRYLHEECQKKIVHYDIKPGNVLLGPNFVPKVGDFGLAKLFDRGITHITATGGRGTPGYAAPELWMPFPVTYKCDVYSFGMMLFEILGRRRNLEFSKGESQEWFPKWIWNKYEEGEMEKILEECGVKEENREGAERMCKVALWCIQYQPEARPTMTGVVRMLEGEMEIVPPVNPFGYMTGGRPSPGLLSSSNGDSTSNSRATPNDGNGLSSSS